MNSLFVRIFLCFWLAMGLIVIAGVTLMINGHSVRSETLSHLDPASFARDASSVAKTQGKDALVKWVRETEHAYPMLTIFIVDRAKRDILGRHLSDGADDRIQAYRARSFRRYVEVEGGEAIAEYEMIDRQAHQQSWSNIRRLTLPDGERLELIFDPAFGNAVTGLDAPHLPWVLLLFGIAVSGLTCWILARYVLTPVRQLQLDVRQLAREGMDKKFTSAVATRPDEVGVLARDVEGMATRIQDLLEMKETLLRDVSHELRSPLARLRVALGLARRGGDRLPVQLDRIERECLFLEAMTSRILEAASVKARNTQPSSRVILNGVVSSVAQDARFEASGKNVAVLVSCPDTPVVVMGDERELRSAIENVVRNAVRFSPTDAQVNIHLARTADRATLCVEDCGPGVPEANLGRIFEPFFRVAPARDRNSGGVGLGLAIVAGIIDRHQGSIVATNRREASGLIVQISLALA